MKNTRKHEFLNKFNLFQKVLRQVMINKWDLSAVQIVISVLFCYPRACVTGKQTLGTNTDKKVHFRFKADISTCYFKLHVLI